MFVSLLILMLGLNCYSLCLNIKQQNTADTRFSYMYQYKYPAEAVPEGGYPAYIKGLKKEVFGFPMEVSIIGLTDDNPFSLTSPQTGRMKSASLLPLPPNTGCPQVTNSY